MSDHQPDSPRRPWRAHTPASSTALLQGGPAAPERRNRTPVCLQASGLEVTSAHQPNSPRRPWRAHTPASSTAQLRRHMCVPRGKDETPVRPLLLRSCPSTSPTHPGGHGELTRLPRPPRCCGGAPCAGEEESNPCVSPHHSESADMLGAPRATRARRTAGSWRSGRSWSTSQHGKSAGEEESNPCVSPHPMS